MKIIGTESAKLSIIKSDSSLKKTYLNTNSGSDMFVLNNNPLKLSFKGCDSNDEIIQQLSINNFGASKTRSGNQLIPVDIGEGKTLYQGGTPISG